MKATPLLQKICASGHFVLHGTDTAVVICNRHVEIRSESSSPSYYQEDSDWIALARAGVATQLCGGGGCPAVVLDLTKGKESG